MWNLNLMPREGRNGKGLHKGWRNELEMEKSDVQRRADGSYFNPDTYLAFSISFLLKKYLIGSLRKIDNREEEGG